ncbi:hypothetical protein N8I71_17780 [Roseibacterium sp. SDUM158016]|uniref:hypothetical protein n=1 Tax=Roseicyclus sediminis TaxID=2980997 RepID=UPI0021CEF522|nr:hypothetical protein [Roseibacterium sp. SDUM158016]MCU4654693.1 hypothetical protein [Roseibacterium sp. SDUM158016]
MSAGLAEHREVLSLRDFSAILEGLSTSQALIYGIAETSPLELTTKSSWERQGQPADTAARTLDTFSWPDGPAIMMIDYDPEEGGEALSTDALVAAIRSAVPGLAQVDILSWASSSSWIKNRDTGEWVSRLRGQRLYIMVEDGSDILRAGQVLFDRLWLAGHGYVKVSKSGTMLLRTLADAGVWQANRLDFAGGAHCEEPLLQDRGRPRLHPGGSDRVDTSKALPDLNAHERDLLESLQGRARVGRQEEASTVREAYVGERAREIAGPGADDDAVEAAKKSVRRALDTRRLPGDFVLEVEVDGEVSKVTVGEVLDAPAKYNGAKTRDAFEPGYDGGRIVGRLFLGGTKKTLHSFAHGGVTYFLERGQVFITILKGELDKAVNQTLDVLRHHPAFYDFGDELAWLIDGHLHPLEQYRLEQKLGGIIQYQGFDARGNLIHRDPPANLVKRIISLGRIRGLKSLDAVITAPSLRPDGTILDAPGYDAETKLYYHRAPDDPEVAIPISPSAREVEKALATLMKPFEDFPFVEPLDRGIFLAALLSAAVRGILPTCPGFGFDAPVQGSGKTLLAQCVAVLSGDHDPVVYPHASGRDDEEVRKRLMSFLRTGAKAMVWDNVLGTFDSASLAAALTSEKFTDRVLGRSEVITVPNKSLFMFTGNNLTLQGDLVRRILVCRIDPRTDQPFKRSFDLDPLVHVREHRVELIAAALTVLRGCLSSDAEKLVGRMASFEGWSDLVRNTVCWIADDIGQGSFADPLEAVSRALEHDPDLELHTDLLVALRERYGEREFLAADVYQSVRQEPGVKGPGTAHALWEALVAINEQTTRSASTIGKALSYRKDRVAGGLVLRTRKDGHTKKSVWWVEEKS